MASFVMQHCSCSFLPTTTHNRASPSCSSSSTRTTTPRMGRRSSSSSAARMQQQHQQQQQQNECHEQQVYYGHNGDNPPAAAATRRDCKFFPSTSSSVSSSVTSSVSHSVCNRREIFYLGAAATTAAAVGMVTSEEAMAEEDPGKIQKTREPAAAPTKPTTKPTMKNDSKVDMTITDKVYLDLTICPSAARSDRTLGNSSQLCTVGEPLGRIVIGLYGRLVPQTVRNFKAMIAGAAGGTYAGTIFHRVYAGQYIQGGRQGSREKGEVSGLLKLERNQETVSSMSYKLTHSRPGTVSLALAENDDDEDLKLDLDYRNVQFLITTGPGPAPQLDNGNIVFGTVMEGLDVVAAVAAVPTYKPNERIKQFNDFATFLGDERAANARNFWDRPLRSVVISGCGELPLGFPVFPYGLP